MELAITLKGKDKGEKAAMFESNAADMSWDPRAGAAASAWQQWDGRAVKKGGNAGIVPAAVRTSSPPPFGTVAVKRRTSLSRPRRWRS